MTAIDVIEGRSKWSAECSDCIPWLESLPASVDLCVFSPPYERARLYLEDGKDLLIARSTEEWVTWMKTVFLACLRVTKGLVVCVCEGQTKNYSWSAAPALLMADLVRWGVTLRKPPIYRRVGIPGSGGPDWWRNDWEPIICATNGGKLPWSDNTASGHAPKWAPGGEMSNRRVNGSRVNGNKNAFGVRTDKAIGTRPTGDKTKNPERENYRAKTRRAPAGTTVDGELEHAESYLPPVLANPGNVIDCIVGGGVMGSKLASLNEAPFPESLVEPFVRCFCPEGGIVCDPFAGSGTTLAVAVKWGRRAIGCDLRQSQIDLIGRRMKETVTLFT